MGRTGVKKGAGFNIKRRLVTSRSITLGMSIIAVGVLGLFVATYPTTVKAALPAPGGVDGVSLWLKADQGLVANGSNQVLEWDDQSGNGLIANQARAASTDSGVAVPTNNIMRVANGINFNPTVDFAGVSDYSLRGSASVSWNSVADLNMFAVNLSEGQSPGTLSGLFTTNGSWTTTTNVGRGLLASKAGNSYMLDGAGCSPGATVASTRTHIARGIYVATNTTAGGSTWLDGAKAFDTAGCTQGTGGVNFEIGGRTADTGFENRIFNGKIPEVIVYKSALTATQAQQIDSYLGIKYGVTLSSPSLDYLASDGTTKVWDAAANAGYYNNVFGIGRDDNSTLNQKQSKSMNDGAIVTIGNGNTIAADNAGNTNTFAMDKTFMMTGDNGAQLSASGLLTGTTTNQARMARVWKVQEAGAAGSVKVRIPVSALPGTSPVLVRSTDATFTTSDTVVPMTLNGTDYEADYNFIDGDFFTFAAVGTAPGGVFGLTTWQKANDGVTNGSSTGWIDASGNGNTANKVGATFNGAGMNFNPAFDLDGSDSFDYATNLGVTGTNSFMTFGAYKQNGLGGTFDGSNNGANQQGMSLVLSASGTVGIGGSGSVTGTCAVTSTSSSPANIPAVGTWLRTSSNNGSQASVNGAAPTNGTCNHSISAATRMMGRRNQQGVSAGFLTGAIAERIQYGSTLTAQQQQQVQSYLAVKYGVTLAVGKNYLASDGSTAIWNTATNTAYQNNVTGIGRDDLSALNQKQSRSVNPQGIVTMGLGAIAADNVSNPNNFADDKDFLVFGDDNNPVTTWVDTGVTNTTLTNFKRIARTWKAQDTGAVGNVTLSLDTADPDADVPDAISGYYLLRDSNNNGSFADDTPILMSDAGSGLFNVSGIDLADGELFTFVTLSNTYDVQIQVADNITSEDGKTGLFKVRLGARPSAPVTITLSSSNTNEGTVPASITIQPDDWDNFEANQVIVTGVNDGVPSADGAVQYFINTDDVTSADPNFNALTGADVANVLMYNLNDDAPGISVYSFGGNVTTENGGCATVRFELLSQPTASVTIPLSLSNTSEGTLNGVTQITIQPANWNQPANNVVTICGLPDGQVDGDVLYYLVTGNPTSADPMYDAITADEVADVALVNVNVDTDGDGDGVDDAVEDAAPNAGDVNEDGIADSTQRNVTSFVNDVTGEYATLQLNADCQVQSVRVNAEASQTAVDTGYEYPVGLMNFQANCGTPGYTAQAVMYFFGANGDLVLRKHNPNTGAYFTINGALVEVMTVAGVSGMKATFDITDGSNLDVDGASDGIITDPAGLALQLPVPPPTPVNDGGNGSGDDGNGLAATGHSTAHYALSAILLIIAGLGVIWGRRKSAGGV